MLKSFIAEMIGTYGLVFAGTGAIMIDELSGGRVGNVGIGLTFGLIVSAMVHSTGHISGAHINPAVTLSLALCRHFSWRSVPLYWAAQLIGAAAASAVLLALLGEVGSMGSTLPSGSVWQSFGLEIVLTFFLMFVIMAVATDTRAVGQTAALAIGGTVALEAIFAGPISGASMNPARSFGPALTSGIWGTHWVYWAGPILGAAAGSVVYTFLRGQEHSVSDHREQRKP